MAPFIFLSVLKVAGILFLLTVLEELAPWALLYLLWLALIAVSTEIRWVLTLYKVDAALLALSTELVRDYPPSSLKILKKRSH